MARNSPTVDWNRTIATKNVAVCQSARQNSRLASISRKFARPTNRRSTPMPDQS
jgi:hypothetical protein